MSSKVLLLLSLVNAAGGTTVTDFAGFKASVGNSATTSLGANIIAANDTVPIISSVTDWTLNGNGFTFDLTLRTPIDDFVFSANPAYIFSTNNIIINRKITLIVFNII